MIKDKTIFTATAIRGRFVIWALISVIIGITASATRSLVHLVNLVAWALDGHCAVYITTIPTTRCADTERYFNQ
jgi:hypothetical protein